MIPETYTLPELSKRTGIALNTLRQWYVKQWLQPYLFSGIRPRFRSIDFERARLQSLIDANNAPIHVHSNKTSPQVRTNFKERLDKIFQQ